MANFRCKNCGATNEVKKNKEFGITQRAARIIYVFVFVPILIWAVTKTKDTEVILAISLIVIISMLYNSRNIIK
jgi:hypothetical protein